MSKEAVRIGVPYRTLEEEKAGAAKSAKIEFYYRALRNAGAEPVPISLETPAAQLADLCAGLDGFVLPGSPADVDPALYSAARHPETAAPDAARERTDYALLDHAFATGKPVLAICYGNQLLNIYRGGSLIQDIPSELPEHLQHEKADGETRDPEHAVLLETGTRLAALAGATGARINSSHHQSIRRAGSGLRVTAHAPDGVIEGVEWTGGPGLPAAGWILGVQWHPERMEGDSFAASLFRELVGAAQYELQKK
ncbi:MAG TPA: gamma-glutamyl-gamma-aminobutyrate hydrolase family protein [Candidatus Binatia bacterium]|nr:gamma-glutamyl-gamma-aminobutyrate hydrolase family protein [Candidatus Binatia bacterium]